MAQLKPKCTICDSPYHYATFCPRRPQKPTAANKPLRRTRRPIRRESVKHRKLRVGTIAAWRLLNPPDENGQWPCYLRIAPNCRRMVGEETINYEHKESKVRRPDLVNDPTNIGAACTPCNELKGSRCLSELVEQYPHLQEHLP